MIKEISEGNCVIEYVPSWSSSTVLKISGIVSFREEKILLYTDPESCVELIDENETLWVASRKNEKGFLLKLGKVISAEKH